jgi:hypothetical protein
MLNEAGIFKHDSKTLQLPIRGVFKRRIFVYNTVAAAATRK